jgi:hypothetical protein
MLIMPGGNAMYSQNDQCTMADITSAYWMYSSNAMKTASAGVLVIVLGLFGF